MTTHLYRAEIFYYSNTEQVDLLVKEIRDAGYEESDLDDLVHTDAASGKVSSDEASAVNNAGLAFQVASVIEGNGFEQGVRMIREELGIEAPAPR